jgi:hypothetical protein
MVMKKSVRFDLCRNTERTFVVPHDIPLHALWFTTDEFNEIKRTSRSDCRGWRKVYSHVLNDTFEHPVRADVQDYLNAYCLMQGDLYMRGMERQINRCHGEQRSESKDQARYVVFDTQRRLKSAKAVTKLTRTCSSSSDASLPTTSTIATSCSTTPTAVACMEEQLAELYMASCRDARIFAIRMALADEHVALEHHSSNVDGNSRVQLAVAEEKFHRRDSGVSVQSASTIDSYSVRLRQYQLRTSSSDGGCTASSRSSHPKSPQKQRRQHLLQQRKCPNSPLSSMVQPHQHRQISDAYAAIA